MEILAGDAKRLIQGIQKLRHLGIEDFVVPLPKICVVGDQSMLSLPSLLIWILLRFSLVGTGKSSLIEGMR